MIMKKRSSEKFWVSCLLNELCTHEATCRVIGNISLQKPTDTVQERFPSSCDLIFFSEMKPTYVTKIEDPVFKKGCSHMTTEMFLTVLVQSFHVHMISANVEKGRGLFPKMWTAFMLYYAQWVLARVANQIKKLFTILSDHCKIFSTLSDYLKLVRLVL